jgi:hypothetical protein
MKKEPTFNDFREAKPEELKKHYGLDSRQLEQAHRKILKGASRQDIQGEYKRFYEEQRK